MLALALHAGTPTGTEYLMSRILLYHANIVKLSLSIDLWMGSPSSVVLPQILMSHLEFLFSPVLKCWCSVMMGKYRYWVNVVAAAQWQANAPFLFHVTWHGTSPIQSQALVVPECRCRKRMEGKAQFHHCSFYCSPTKHSPISLPLLFISTILEQWFHNRSP